MESPSNSDNPYSINTFSFHELERLDSNAFRGEPVLASRLARFIASFIDIAVFLVCFAPVAVLFLFAIDSNTNDKVARSTIEFCCRMVGVGVFMAINGYFLYRYGQTFGKVLLGLYIVDEDSNELLPMNRLIQKRYVPIWVLLVLPTFPVMILNIVGPMLLILDLILIFQMNRKCYHDMLAKTNVVWYPRR